MTVWRDHSEKNKFCIAGAQTGSECSFSRGVRHAVCTHPAPPLDLLLL